MVPPAEKSPLATISPGYALVRTTTSFRTGRAAVSGGGWPAPPVGPPPALFPATVPPPHFGGFSADNSPVPGGGRFFPSPSRGELRTMSRDSRIRRMSGESGSLAGFAKSRGRRSTPPPTETSVLVRFPISRSSRNDG